jgi:hypothetical protein
MSLLNMNLSNIIYQKLLQTNQKIISKQDIINYTGIYNIDYIIDVPNFFICISIQNKVHDFINDVIQLSHIFNRPSLGIYIHLFKLDKNQENLFRNNNTMMTNFLYITTFSNTKIINKLCKILYSYNIYLYDTNGDCVMIES